MMPASPLPRRALRFSIRTILLAMVALAIALAWVHRARDQRADVARMLASNPGAAVLYDYELNPDGGLSQPGTPPGPKWLRELLGIDYLANVAGIDMFYPTDADLECVTRFPHLRRLHLERSIDVTDAGLAQLAALSELEYLALGEADQVTDAGLRSLAGLKSLKLLRLDPRRRMTPEGIESLRRALPNCRIEFRENPDEEFARDDELVGQAEA